MAAEYTFSFFQGALEPMFSRSLSFPNDVEAIRDAGEMLAVQAALANSPMTSITVARGAGDQQELLGAWELEGGVRRWRPRD